jgi:hypothetical protein
MIIKNNNLLDYSYHERSFKSFVVCSNWLVISLCSLSANRPFCIPFECKNIKAVDDLKDHKVLEYLEVLTSDVSHRSLLPLTKLPIVM